MACNLRKYRVSITGKRRSLRTEISADIRQRITAATTAIVRLKKIQNSRSRSFETKLKLSKYLVTHILLYS